ncbi:MAG: glutathione S-transferase family protein [Kofleriaceae bacterium]
MKLYGHPWSVNTRKTLTTLEEKGHPIPLTLVMIPKGEQNRPEHLRIHPFGKVPVLDDDGFIIYETRAINAYLDGKLAGPELVPLGVRPRARMDQWINVADSYFIPFAHQLIVELLFRRYLGGEPSQPTIAAGRTGIEKPLDAIERALGETPYLAGDAFSLADIHWIPYVEYLQQIGEGAPIKSRPNVAAWWQRISARPGWQKVARTGPQPYETGMTTDAVERLYR